MFIITNFFCFYLTCLHKINCLISKQPDFTTEKLEKTYFFTLQYELTEPSKETIRKLII